MLVIDDDEETDEGDDDEEMRCKYNLSSKDCNFYHYSKFSEQKVKIRNKKYISKSKTSGMQFLPKIKQQQYS